MQTEVWYDLILRELSSGSDRAEELRRDAEVADTTTPEPGDEDDHGEPG